MFCTVYGASSLCLHTKANKMLMETFFAKSLLYFTPLHRNIQKTSELLLYYLLLKQATFQKKKNLFKTAVTCDQHFQYSQQLYKKQMQICDVKFP